MSRDERDREVRERIITESSRLFLAEGYSRVTVDEIVESLGISKKTLYRHFSKKEELLDEVFEEIKNSIIEEIDSILNDEELELIEKIKKLLTVTAMKVATLEKSFIKDVKGRQPRIWDKMKLLERDKLMNRCEALFDEGVRKGLFKKNLNKKLVIRFYFEAVRNILSSDLLFDLPTSLDELLNSILIIIFEGVFTEEGHRNYRSSR